MAKKKANGNTPPGIMKAVEVERIRAEADIQARVEMNFATITTYFERMMEGDKFPPVIVFDDGRELWLADGFHRLAAAKRACRKKIEARVVKGSREDAAWFALGANRTNGLPMSTADKMRAIKQALLLRAHESNRSIADYIGVSHHTVAKYRRELESIGQIAQCSTRETSDGRQYPASRREVDDDPPPSPPSTTVKTNNPPPVVPDEPPTVVKADPPPGVTDQPPKVDDQPPSVPDLPKDRVGNPITDPTIAAIFKRDRELVELCTAVSKVKTAVLKPAEAGDPLYAGLLTGRFRADVDNVRRQIDHLRPYAICPYCRAAQPKLASCDACQTQGWVNETVYTHAPADYKQGRH